LPNRHRIQLATKALALAAALWLLAAPVRAQTVPAATWAQQQSTLCTEAIRVTEQRYGMPHGLLGSIAKVESGRPITAMGDVRAWPWTIDADGQGLFLDSKEAAVAWMRTAGTHGHTYIDVGCMQVDLAMHPTAFASLEQAFEPAANVDYAARYLHGLWQNEAGQDWDIAVGLYHSHTPMLAADYRDRVAATGAGILGGTLRQTPLYVRAIRQGSLRLQLSSGHVMVINVNRQPAMRHRRLTACQIEQILGPYLNTRGAPACSAGPLPRPARGIVGPRDG